MTPSLEELEGRDAPARPVAYDRPAGAVDAVGQVLVVPDRELPASVTVGGGPLLVVVDDADDLYDPAAEEALVVRIWDGLAPFQGRIAVTNSPASANPRVPPWAYVTGVIVREITWRPPAVVGESSGYLYTPDIDTEPRFHVERYFDPGNGRDDTHRAFVHELGHVAGLGHDPEPTSPMFRVLTQMDPEPVWPDRDVPVFLGGVETTVARYRLDALFATP